MPFAFPSHQGLIAPLWRRWPRSFSVLACCIGAAVPDIVDGSLGFVRGHLGQGFGHSLAGLFALCVPVGFALHLAVIAIARRYSNSKYSARIEEWAAIEGAPSIARRRWIEVWSILVGAFSHLFFDFISHENFLWLYPWYENEKFFPSWWYQRWIEIPLPWYERPYPAGPHFLVWAALSVIGAWMLFRPRKPAQKAFETGT